MIEPPTAIHHGPVWLRSTPRIFRKQPDGRTGPSVKTPHCWAWCYTYAIGLGERSCTEKDRTAHAAAKMNFYPPPPVIEAELYVRIPDDKRCIGEESEWRGGFTAAFQYIFLEGPVADADGNLYAVNIPYGRILEIDAQKDVTVLSAGVASPTGL